jgi:DNA-binding IclR family transcriptional regulator
MSSTETLSAKVQDKKPNDADRQGIQSLEIGIEVFRRLHEAGRPMRLGEMAEATGMHPSKAHRYIVSLVRSGLVQQDARGLYSLGPLAMQLCQSQAWYAQALEFGAQALRSLAPEIGETVFLSAWGQSGPRILRVEEASKAISVRPRTTGELPLWNSSPGRLFAAHMPIARLAPLLDREFAQLAIEHRWSAVEAERRRKDYKALLDDVRRQGLAWTKSERFPGINSVAAPVFEARGEVLFTLTAFGMEGSFPLDLAGAAAKAIHHMAVTVTQQVGGQAPRI